MFYSVLSLNMKYGCTFYITQEGYVSQLFEVFDLIIVQENALRGHQN